MELKQFLDENDNYLDLFVQHKLQLRKRRHLTLVKYPYEMKSITHDWIRYCRGCIIDTSSRRLVCIPPPKAHEYEKTKTYENEFTIQPLLDGTMVNISYMNGSFQLSTRSDIGGKNNWNKKSIERMVRESTSYEKLIKELNPKLSYSFVLNHTNIRHIAFVTKNKLTLVKCYDRETCEEQPLKPSSYYEILPTESATMSIHEYVSEFEKFHSKDPQHKGLTFQFKTHRVKYINPSYTKVKDTLTGNTDNKLFRFSKVKQTQKLKEYLEMYPEDTELFSMYSEKYEAMIEAITNSYHSLFIHKTKTLKEIPFRIKPIMYELHTCFLKENAYISKHYVRNYVSQLKPNRIAFLMNETFM